MSEQEAIGRILTFPDLLFALEGVLAAVEDCQEGDVPEACAIARALVAKVRGAS